MPVRTITQFDLAQRLGVTQMTVSHALSGKGRIAPETRERVLTLARELGYRHNGMARRVQAGSYRGMALLGSASRPGYNISDMTFHLSVGSKLAERSWHLTESWLPGAGLADPDIVSGLLDRMLADAVLVHDVGEQPSEVETLLAAHRIPAVWINTGRAIDAVDFDDQTGAATALQHLLSQGYRSPALLMPNDPRDPDQHVSVALRVAGWTAGSKAAGLVPRVVWPETGRALAGVRPFLTALLRSPDRPDALACYTQHEMFAVRIVAAEQGVTIGRDLGLMTFCKPEAARVYDSAYTVCGLDYAALGSEAVAMAWRRLETGRPQPKVLIAEDIAHHGATTSRAR